MDNLDDLPPPLTPEEMDKKWGPIGPPIVLIPGWLNCPDNWIAFSANGQDYWIDPNYIEYIRQQFGVAPERL